MRRREITITRRCEAGFPHVVEMLRCAFRATEFGVVPFPRAMPLARVAQRLWREIQNDSISAWNYY